MKFDLWQDVGLAPDGSNCLCFVKVFLFCFNAFKRQSNESARPNDQSYEMREREREREIQREKLPFFPPSFSIFFFFFFPPNQTKDNSTRPRDQTISPTKGDRQTDRQTETEKVVAILFKLKDHPARLREQTISPVLRERERERETETETETETERQTDRQTDRERETERARVHRVTSERERERERERAQNFVTQGLRF